MEISWYGTASIKIQSKKHCLLIDPFVPMAPSTVPVSISDYYGVSDILLTHGHFDHIQDVPELCKNRSVSVYATATPVNTLQALGVMKSQLHLIRPGDSLSFDDITVRTYQSKHIRLDFGLIGNRERRRKVYTYPKEFFYCLSQQRIKRENGEILAFEITSEGRSVFILGSLGLDTNVVYPQNMDMLVLPYQGSRKVLELSTRIVEKLQPKAILLDHFDDTFPPITAHEDTSEIKQYYAGKIPVFEIDYRTPISI